MQYFRATKQRRNINYSSCNEEDIVEFFLIHFVYFLFSLFILSPFKSIFVKYRLLSFNSMKVS